MKYTFLFLLFVLGACSEEPGELLQPQLLTPQDVSLKLSDSVLLADGKVRGEALFTILPKDVVKNRQVIFDISPVGKFSNGATSLTIPLDVKGQARVFYSSTAEGVAYVRATVGSLTTVGAIRFQKVIALDTLSLQVVRDQVAADNYSYAEIMAITKTPESITNRSVKLVTDNGSFANGLKEYTVNFGLDSSVKAYLKHNRTEVVRVTAAVNDNYSKELHLSFVPSWPEALLVEPGTNVVPPLFSSKVKIMAKLSKVLGSVSPGHTVVFYDSTTSNTVVGIFVNTTKSNEAGEATTDYLVQDTAYRGPVYIKAYVNTPTGRIGGVNRMLLQ